MFHFNASNRKFNNVNKKWKNEKFRSNKSEKGGDMNGNDIHGIGINRKENIDDIFDYLSNVSYIVNDKYEKYFVYEVKEDKLKKGNKIFNNLNLHFVYNLEEDITIIEKIKKEIKGYELDVLNVAKFCKLLEKVLIYSFFLLKYNEENVNNPDISIQCLKIYNHFFKIVKSNLFNLSQLTYASHFVQSLISVFPFFAKYEEVYVEQIKKEDKSYEEIREAFIKVCDEVTEQIYFFLFNKFGTHVLRAFFYVLAGYLRVNISYRKSKISKQDPQNHLNYLDTNYSYNEKFLSYFPRIIQKFAEECENPSVSLEHKNIYYQYIFCDNINDKKKNEKEKDKKDKKDKKNKKTNKGKNLEKDIMEDAQLSKDSDKTKKKINDKDDKILNDLSNDITNELIMESENQHFICPMLYNVYSIGALTAFFEILKEKNIDCKNLCEKIFLIEQTKKYNFQKAHEKLNNVEYASPLNQELDILLKSQDASILIERILKTNNNEHNFYVFTNYILNNLNKLLLENIFSYTVLCNYITTEFITEEMFDMIMKSIDIESIIEKKKFTILKRLFDLSRYYQIHCKHLVNTLIKSFNLLSKNNGKYMWICIITMCSYDNLSDCIKNVLNKEGIKDGTTEGTTEEITEGTTEGKDENNEQNKCVTPTLNNYNFSKHFTYNLNGCEILSHMLAFPKEAIIPILGSFSGFVKFLENVNNNKATEEDILSYENYRDFLLSKCQNKYYPKDNVNNYLGYECDNNSKKMKNSDKVINDENTNGENTNGENTNDENTNVNVCENKDNVDDTETHNNSCNIRNQSDVDVGFEREEKNNGIYFVMQKLEVRKNILLFFACDKTLSVFCEKISHFLNIVNEKYLKKFILLFKDVFKFIAAHYIGCHVIVTFFKLGTNEIKKGILDELIKEDISKYNSYINKYMKIKEYIKTKEVNTNDKYAKVKKMFEDILLPKEEKSVQNNFHAEMKNVSNEFDIEKEDQPKKDVVLENKENNKKTERDSAKKKKKKLKKEECSQKHGSDTENKKKSKKKEKKVKKKIMKEQQKQVKTDKKMKEKKIEKEKRKEQENKLKKEEKKAKKNKNKKHKKEETSTPSNQKKRNTGTEDITSTIESDNSSYLTEKRNEPLQGEGIQRDALVDVISNFIVNTKKKSRKRKQEKETIETVLKKKV